METWSEMAEKAGPDVKSESSEDVEALSEQFSRLGGKFVYHVCMKFIDNVKKEYPNVPEKDFVKLMMVTFKESNIQMDLKTPATRSKVEDENRCTKILQTGKNKGCRCSLPKTEGSSFCKRHKNSVLISGDKDKKHLRQKQMKQYLDILQPKTSEIGKPKPLKLKQYKDENVYLEASTKMVFRKEDDGEFTAFGVYVDGKGIMQLSSDDILLCERNSWRYKYDTE